MRKVTETVVSDLSGVEGADTVVLSVDQMAVEIDLTAEELDSLLEMLDPYMENGRRTTVRSRGAGGKKTAAAASGRGDAKVVRAWAVENNVDVPKRGRIPAEVYEAYDNAKK